ncbi:MAG: hypothetical protein K9J16_04965 [Melioribacteraceae bacterium]|nr:hypothetical protein [Melioribacteraceae bacterium]MCF8354195.1 hypothetical protein [Melioribacteraceae bacterium]MCF8392841.1 hypothetical protein [Melioribacteraceae bacterium]MCF8418673.1 hypothetical protein [Melioribacteraceae bacterium]
MKKKIKKEEKQVFPVFCDYSCQFADFTDPDAIGACRKDLAVWCDYFKRYNNKHNKCFGAK